MSTSEQTSANHNHIRLYDKVTHPELYNGNEVFTVVGIRMHELELRGDWSGGTHNVDQTGWFKRDGVRHFYTTLIEKSK